MLLFWVHNDGHMERCNRGYHTISKDVLHVTLQEKSLYHFLQSYTPTRKFELSIGTTVAFLRLYSGETTPFSLVFSPLRQSQGVITRNQFDLTGASLKLLSYNFIIIKSEEP